MLPNSNYIQNLPIRLQKKIKNNCSGTEKQKQPNENIATSGSSLTSLKGYVPQVKEVHGENSSRALKINNNIPGVLKITSDKKDEEVRQKSPSKVHVSSRKRCLTPAWIHDFPSKSEHLIDRLKTLNCEMECLFKNGLTDFKKMFELTNGLEEIFLELLETQLVYCCKQGVDTFFWKILFYNNIQYLKNKYISTKSKSLKEKVEELIQEGIAFYEKSFTMMEEQYLNTPKEKLLTVAKVMAQKMLINIGNLHRYKTLISGHGNFELSSTYYMKAHQLLPANGVPFNQMAIISIYKKRTFDAVYYHIRSLMSSNSIQSANESLQEIFDKIKKKEAELKADIVSENKSKKHDEINKFRTEEWIYPNNDEELNSFDMDNKSSSEILRRFHLIYLNIIGMLFTGIGLDNFDESLQLAASLFSYLLKDQQMFSQQEIFQILTINIFSVEYKMGTEGRKEIFKKSIHLSSLFFTVILEAHLNNISTEDTNSNSKKYLQFLYIFSFWMWNKKYYDQYFINSLSTVGNFHDVIKKFIDFWSPKVTNINSLDVPKKLFENEFFTGFKPMTDLGFEEENYSDLDEDEYRLKIIFIFLTKISSFYDNILKNERETVSDFKSTSFNNLNCVNKEETLYLKPQKEGEDIDEEILKLSKRKEELQKKTKLDQICRDKFQEILKNVNEKVHIEIRPKYLVPDTNCFIDSLEELQLIANNFENYFLVVPLIVVKELDGLSRGFKATNTSSALKKKNIHHFDEVSTLAKKSIEFIHNSSHVKCATTKGSILNSSMFSLEEDESLSNDDKILSTAIALQNQLKSEKILQDKYFLRTEILLLTTDRNLRVKALTRNLVVRELKEFIKWAQKS